MNDQIVVCICSDITLALQVAIDVSNRLKALDPAFEYGYPLVKESSKGFGFVVHMPEASFKVLGYEQRYDLTDLA